VNPSMGAAGKTSCFSRSVKCALINPRRGLSTFDNRLSPYPLTAFLSTLATRPVEDRPSWRVSAERLCRVPPFRRMTTSSSRQRMGQQAAKAEVDPI
jgi:hypothetical protein